MKMGEDPQDLLNIEQLSVGYRSLQVLEDLSLTVGKKKAQLDSNP